MKDGKKNAKLKHLDNSFLCLKYKTFLKHFLLLLRTSLAKKNNIKAGNPGRPV